MLPLVHHGRLRVWFWSAFLFLFACSPVSVAVVMPDGGVSHPAPHALAARETPTPSLTITSTRPATTAPTFTPVVRLDLQFVSPTPTFTPTATPTETPTPTATVTPTPSPEPTATPIPLPTGTPTLEPPAAAEPGVRTARVPILTYHYIRPLPDRTVDPLGYNLSVAPETFDQQVAYLKEQGYKTIRVADFVSYLKTGEPPLPPKPIILTFDDGYLDAYTDAFRILRQHGMIGTFFVITGFVEQERFGYASWEQLREMSAAGMEIGSHAVSHVDLTLKTAAAAEIELAQSRRTLEERLGAPVTVLAYPYGKVNARVMGLAARYYEGAVSTQGGVLHSTQTVMELRRVQISGGWDVGGFKYVLNYWLNGAK